MLATSTQSILDMIPKIRVIIRKRPLMQKELSRGETDIVEVRNESVNVKEMK